MRHLASSPTLILLLPMLTAAAPIPSPPALTDDELALLNTRKLVVRSDLTDPTGGTAIGIIDIRATPERTFAAVVDLGSRKDEISGIKELTIYDRGDNWLAARWELKVIASSIVFHVRYDLDPARYQVLYALDPSKSNDLVRVEGSYLMTPVEGGTRLVYHSTSDTKHTIPVWIKRWVASEGLSQQLSGIRARAERTSARVQPSGLGREEVSTERTP